MSSVENVEVEQNNANPVGEGSRAGDERPVDRRASLTRLAAAAAVLTLLVGADAMYMQVTKYGGSDRNNFGMTDAATVWVAAVILLLVTLALLALRQRARRTP